MKYGTWQSSTRERYIENGLLSQFAFVWMWNNNNKKGGEEEEETDNQNIAALFACTHRNQNHSCAMHTNVLDLIESEKEERHIFCVTISLHYQLWFTCNRQTEWRTRFVSRTVDAWQIAPISCSIVLSISLLPPLLVFKRSLTLLLVLFLSPFSHRWLRVFVYHLLKHHAFGRNKNYPITLMTFAISSLIFNFGFRFLDGFVEAHQIIIRAFTHGAHMKADKSGIVRLLFGVHQISHSRCEWNTNKKYIYFLRENAESFQFWASKLLKIYNECEKKDEELSTCLM